MTVGKKGQGAMEYLMSYGWALIIVLIIGIVLFNSGVFDQNAESATGWMRIRPSNFRFSMTNPSQIAWDNVAGQSLRNVTFTYSGDCVEPAATIGNMAQGARIIDAVTCSTTCSPIGAGLVVNATVEYRTEDTIEHKEAVKIRALCET
ncbi:MAG: hypothetical protein J4432_05375 [DPANN group archaeon]|nr:hypothetical protein [DPANN group archaeon]